MLGEARTEIFFVCVFLNYCHNVGLLSRRRHILSILFILFGDLRPIVFHICFHSFTNKMVQHIRSSYVAGFIAATSIENTTNRKLTWVRIGTGPTVVLISGKSTSNPAPNNRSKAKGTGRQSKLDSVSLPLRLDYPFHRDEIIQKKKKWKTIKISECFA